jgi:hypothetical protein
LDSSYLLTRRFEGLRDLYKTYEIGSGDVAKNICILGLLGMYGVKRKEAIRNRGNTRYGGTVSRFGSSKKNANATN